MRGCACRGTAGFAHVSCLAEEAKTLLAEALENNLDDNVKDARFNRWHTCSLCEQQYHGVVFCALGWACWKTYLGRPERDQTRKMAMSLLGTGLSAVDHYEDALCVQTAELAMLRRVGASEERILGIQSNLSTTDEYARRFEEGLRMHNINTAQGNLARTLGALGRFEEALSIQKDAYFGHLKLYGEENEQTLGVVNNYASDLTDLKRFGEAKSLLRKMMPVARRVLGASHEYTLKMRKMYAITLSEDPARTVDDLSEAVTTLEEADRTARRVFGGAHPLTTGIESNLREARAALAAREGDVEYIREALQAMTPREAVNTLERWARETRRRFGGGHPQTVVMEQNLRHARAALSASEGDVESIREAVEAMAPGDA